MKQLQQPKQARPAGFNHLAQRVKTDQRGVASLIITMVTMVVISLIVVGFATISRREQRQSLDQQLSTQAFYAAESGVEDAKSVIKAFQASNPNKPIPAKPDCTGDPSGLYPASAAKTSIDQAYNVSYTCLTVDPSPKSLQFNGVNEHSLVIPIKTVDPITSVRLTWSPTAPPAVASTNCPNTTNMTLRQQSNWNCGYGMIRADVTPTDSASNPLNRANLTGNTVTSFFEPLSAGAPGTIDYASSRSKPNIVGAKCVTTGGAYGTCQATIEGFTGDIRSLSLRISSLYQPSNLKIEALDGIAPQKINGVQAAIDSTGKAGDVLRRINVRLPVVARSLLPDYALQSNSSICKHFASIDGYFEITGVIDPDSTNPMCLPATDGAIPACVAYNDLEFILDRSGSMKDDWQTTTKMAKMKELTKNFIDNLEIATNKNHAGISSFSTGANNDQPLTDNTPDLLAAIDGLNPNGGTKYIDGLNVGVQDFNTNGRADAKKVIIFITDGEPRDAGRPASITTQTDALMTSGVSIYTIGIANDLGTGRQVLNDMAGNGGRFGDASSEADLDAILKSITLDLACK